MNSNIYQFQDSHKRRRVGLSRHGHGLLNIVGNNKPRSTDAVDMHSSSTSTKDEHVNKGPLRPLKGNSRISKQTEREEDILAPPKELSDDDFSSSDDERLRAATIKPTTFKSGNGAQKSSSQNPRGRAGSKQTSNQVAASKSKRSGHHTVAQNDTSPKRKIPEDVPSSSADIFGSIKSKKAKSTYGSSSQNKKLSSSQVSAPRSTQGLCPTQKINPYLTVICRKTNCRRIFQIIFFGLLPWEDC